MCVFQTVCSSSYVCDLQNAPCLCAVPLGIVWCCLYKFINFSNILFSLCLFQIHHLILTHCFLFTFHKHCHTPRTTKKQAKQHWNPHGKCSNQSVCNSLNNKKFWVWFYYFHEFFPFLILKFHVLLALMYWQRKKADLETLTFRGIPSRHFFYCNC